MFSMREFTFVTSPEVEPSSDNAASPVRLRVSSSTVDIGAAAVTIDTHSPPAEKTRGQKFEGADSVSTVVGKLRDEANVI